MSKRQIVAGHSYPLAESPLGLHKRDWIEVAKRIKDEVIADDISMVAAASAYYALFAIFPLLIATVSLYGFVSDPWEIEQELARVSRFMPSEAFEVLSKQLHAIIESPRSALGLSALVSLAVALWTASSGTKALMKALNIAYDEEEKRGFLRLNLEAITLTAAAVIGIIASVGAIAVLPVVLIWIGIGSFASQFVLWLRWPLLFGLFIFGIAVLNRFGPSRNKAKWRWVSVGALLGTFLILLASLGLATYVKHFGSYNATYGSLSGVVILLLWFYLVSFSVLLSAEVNAEIEHQTLVDSTKGRSKPMGSRGALKADSVPSMEPQTVAREDA